MACNRALLSAPILVNQFRNAAWQPAGTGSNMYVIIRVRYQTSLRDLHNPDTVDTEADMHRLFSSLATHLGTAGV